MQRRLIAIALTVAPLSLAAAIVMLGASIWHPTWWEAGIKLAILSGISSMIYGINFFALPFHARRPWRSMPLVALQLGGAVVGGWMTAIGIGMESMTLERIGLLLAALGGSLFQGNVMLLMTQPAPPRPPKPAKADMSVQQRIDKLATSFTITAGMTVVFGTALGAVLGWWRPTFGRWDLVWAHSMLLGFFFAMASGTSYHTLARWAGAEWRSLTAARVHRGAFLVAFPGMLIALGWDIDWLFLIAGPLMAAAMIGWLWNVVPMALALRGGVRAGILLALTFLVVGAGLGVWFAIDPTVGARLRGSHVLANVFGFAGLLISGFGYRYVPQLAGRPTMQMQALVVPQLMVTALGVVTGIIAYALRMQGNASGEVVLATCGMTSLGLLMFAVNVAATFAQAPLPSVARRPDPSVVAAAQS